MNAIEARLSRLLDRPVTHSPLQFGGAPDPEQAARRAAVCARIAALLTPAQTLAA